MEFTALAVNKGDSFLLKDGDNLILVDGGANQQHIVRLLNKENLNNHINLIVCTHYDLDHVNGILGILKSKKYGFDEMWLPEILGSLAYTISEKHEEILDDLRRQPDLLEKALDEIEGQPELLEEEISSSPESFEHNISDKYQFNTRNITELNNLLNKERLFQYMRLITFYRHNELVNMFYNICKLVSSSIPSAKKKVRWLEYQGREVNNRYGFNMIAVNSRETNVTLYPTTSVFLKALIRVSLTPINQQSLVFKYNDDSVPNVLFTADSDLSFTKIPIILKPKSIVTAPHHGSKHNTYAYTMISGEELFFVRSDHYNPSDRPCKDYINLENKYCTLCNRSPKDNKKPVRLKYKHRDMDVVAAKDCHCVRV